MALHGTIKMNDVIVGEWQAKRTTVTREDMNVYECKVTREKDGEPRTVHFRLGHPYDHGALALAARVISIGNDYIEGKRSGE